MAEVKRYRIEVSGSVSGSNYSMVLDPHGTLIHVSDFNALLAVLRGCVAAMDGMLGANPDDLDGVGEPVWDNINTALAASRPWLKEGK